MNIIKQINKKTLSFLILNAILGIIVIFIIIFFQKEGYKNKITRDLKGGFVYTSPILDCELEIEGGMTTISYQAVNKKIGELSNKYHLSESSVYFRDLNNGPWVGVNEKASFSPASLMKTPLMIGFLKNVEKNPELLNMNIVATEEYFLPTIKQNFEVETKIEKGKTYTLRQVMEIMVQDSDNIAALMLSKYVKQNDLKDLSKSVGVPLDKKFLEIDIRVKDFAAFFRVLYNASYLNREMSELALSVLTSSAFEDGIVAGVPENIEVAHKYGERALSEREVIKEKQLHDCGIVYAHNPYILCIMTKGEDFKAQEHFIADVSSFVYKEVNEN